MFIKISNLTKIYANTTIKYPDVTINSGELVLLTGATGSGKTTFCEIFSQFLSCQTGSIFINNIDIKKHNIFEYTHYIAQNPAQNLIGPTCKEELDFWGNSGKTDGETANSILRIFSLEDLSDRPIWHLSFGEKKLLAFAAVYSVPRQIWLLDEPLAGLEITQQNKIKEMMKDFCQSEGVVIATSHTADDFDSFPQKKVIAL